MIVRYFSKVKASHQCNVWRDELNTAVDSVAKREIFNFRNLEFSDPLLGTCNHYSYNTLPKLYNFLPSFPR